MLCRPRAAAQQAVSLPSPDDGAWAMRRAFDSILGKPRMHLTVTTVLAHMPCLPLVVAGAPGEKREGGRG